MSIGVGVRSRKMHEDDIAELLMNGKSYCSAGEAEQQVPTKPGYYTIFVDSTNALPAPFAKILRDQETGLLLYIGIAKRSLLARLVHQDLHHFKPSTFFRSIGAILDYRPPVGSLLWQQNQCNFKFRAADTRKIIEWIEEHLSVRWHCVSPALPRVEEKLIKLHQPLLNIAHNPSPVEALKALRQECRKIARKAP